MTAPAAESILTLFIDSLIRLARTGTKGGAHSD
jgi:hypothetical protein